MNLGFLELLIIFPIGLLTLGIPLIGLFLLYLVFQKLGKIEKLLSQKIDK